MKNFDARLKVMQAVPENHTINLYWAYIILHFSEKLFWRQLFLENKKDLGLNYYIVNNQNLQNLVKFF